MKKVLFATTALVASAGVAAAQGVALSGSAEMGIIGGDRDIGGQVTDSTQFWNDVDIAFTLSGETDNGLTFGANVDLDEAGNLAREEDNQGTAVFISGNFGTLTLGDTDGAFDFVMQDAATAGNPGSIADDETSHAGYLGAFADGAVYDNQVLRYNYTFGDFTIAISHEQESDPATGVVGVAAVAPGSGSSAIGLRYAGEFGGIGVTAGLAYQAIDTDNLVAGTEVTLWGVSALFEFQGGFSAVLGYSDWEDYNASTGVIAAANSDNHSYIGLGYEFDAISLHANYGEYDSGNSGFGFAAAYDLGGGASVHFGYGYSDGVGINPVDGSDSASTWSFGVAMSF